MMKQKRLEAKKRKIQAFLDVAKLNDDDGRQRKSLSSVKKVKLEEESDNKVEDKSEVENDEIENLRKRLRERKNKLQSIPHFSLKARGKKFFSLKSIYGRLVDKKIAKDDQSFKLPEYRVPENVTLLLQFSH